MRVLVVGASGTLGGPLVREAQARGHEVVGLSRSPQNAERLAALGAEPVVCDILDQEAVAGAVSKAAPQAIVHAATAIPKRGATRPGHLEQTNVLRDQGTRHLAAAARHAQVERFLAESMVFVYGVRGFSHPVAEEQPPASGLNPRQQVLVDALVSLERQTLELPHGIVLRYGLFHGPAAPSSRYMLELASRRRLPIIGAGDGVLPWVDVEDAARATVDALERAPAGAVYNLVDDEPVAYTDYVLELARLVGTKPPRRIPLWLGKLIAPQLADGAAHGQLVVSNARIKRELGWTPLRPTYREALAALVQSAKRKGE